MNIEEASVNVNNQDPVIAIQAALVCSTTDDEYTLGFRNALRFAIAVLTGQKPKYE